MRECCGDEFLFVRMPVVEIYNRDCDCPKCFGRAHSLSIFFYKFNTIFFPSVLVFSVTKRRFHLNVLLFCKYKLWPLKHVLHRRWHNEKEKKKICFFSVILHAVLVRLENWPKMIFYGARERSTRDIHTIHCAIHRFTWTTIGVSIKYINIFCFC